MKICSKFLYNQVTEETKQNIHSFFAISAYMSDEAIKFGAHFAYIIR